MKKFTKAEIEGARNYFRKQEFQEAEATLGARRFSYFIIPHSIEPNLPNFVVRLTGEPSDGYVLGISDEVNEKYRPYALVHEFIEFVETKADVQNKCRRALEEELKLVPEELKSDYLKMRRDFFRALIPYCRKQPESYTANDLSQFEQNLKTLEALAG
ncbi:MAG: hypothetical protein AABX07_00465 [Nanoarchaeota archaeon]